MAEPIRKVRFGIMGAAHINRRLIPAIRQSTHAELHAIASRSLPKATELAQKHQIPTAYGSYEELLQDPEIDAVYIPLPNHLHVPWTMKAANVGKHILCEKPLGINAKEAQQVVDHCREKNVRLMDGFMWPHHPRTASLRQVLDAGTIGTIVRMTGSFTFLMDFTQDNYRHRKHEGGGSLLDVGCYPVYFARWLFQAEPVRVWARASYRDDVDVRMDGLLEFPGERFASFDCGFTLPYRIGVEIVGTQGRIVIPKMWLPPEMAGFQVILANDSTSIHSQPACDQVVCMVNAFAEAVRQARDPIPPPTEAVKTLKVLDALDQAARTNSIITLTE